MRSVRLRRFRRATNHALEGLTGLISTIEQIRDSVNPRLHVEGILRTMYVPRNNLSNDVTAQLIEQFGDKVFRTIIPRNVRLAEAPSFGVPVLFHKKDSRGALAYLALALSLAGEMIRRSEDERRGRTPFESQLWDGVRSGRPAGGMSAWAQTCRPGRRETIKL